MKTKIFIPIIAIVLIFIMPMASALVLDDFEEITGWDTEYDHLDYLVHHYDAAFGEHSMVLESSVEYGCWAGKARKTFSQPVNLSGYSSFIFYAKRGWGFHDPSIAITLKDSQNNSYTYGNYYACGGITINNSEWKQYKFDLPANMADLSMFVIDLYSADGWGNPGELFIDQLGLIKGTTIASSIVLNKNPSIANRKKAIKITAEVWDQDGGPMPDGDVIKFSTNLGNITSSAQTVNGKATAILYSTVAGEATITASASGCSNSTIATYIDECLDAEHNGAVYITSWNIQDLTNQSALVNFTTSCDVATWLTLSPNLTAADYSDAPTRAYSHAFLVENLSNGTLYNVWIGATTNATQPSHSEYGWHCGVNCYWGDYITVCQDIPLPHGGYYTICHQQPQWQCDYGCGNSDALVYDSWKNSMVWISSIGFTTLANAPIPTCDSYDSFRCNDNDVYWFDSCNVKEDKKEECGNSGYTGNNYCYDGNVYKDYRTKTCSTNACISSTEKIKQQDCAYGCSNGQCLAQICSDECSSGQKQCSGNGFQTCGNYDSDSCLEWSSANSCSDNQLCNNGECIDQIITCSFNYDCGVDGFIGNNFCSSGNVMRNYRAYNCLNSGTINSSCSYTDTSKLKQSCSDGRLCEDGACIRFYEFRTAALDYSTEDFIQSAIEVDGITKTGQPPQYKATFTARANKLIKTYYSAEGYKPDTDYIYLDDGLIDCAQGANCNKESNDYSTSCEWEANYNDFACTVTKSDINSAFLYNPGDKTVRRVNYLEKK